MRLSPIVVGVFLIFTVLLGPTHAHAAVGVQNTYIDTINSIRASTTETALISTANTAPIAVFSIPFSLKSYTTEVAIPSTVTRDTGILSNDIAGFTVEMADGTAVLDGTAVGVLIPDTSQRTAQGALYKTSPGKRDYYTLLVAFAPTHSSSTSYRVRLTHMPLHAAGLLQPVQLNRSELRALQTKTIRF